LVQLFDSLVDFFYLLPRYIISSAPFMIHPSPKGDYSPSCFYPKPIPPQCCRWSFRCRAHAPVTSLSRFGLADRMNEPEPACWQCFKHDPTEHDPPDFACRPNTHPLAFSSTNQTYITSHGLGSSLPALLSPSQQLTQTRQAASHSHEFILQ
jgi:hypothetical protein